MNYINRIPAAIPAGMVLVHNNVTRGITPSRKPGNQGFRAWLSKDTSGIEVCPCGWAPQLGRHYRVARIFK